MASTSNNRADWHGTSPRPSSYHPSYDSYPRPAYDGPHHPPPPAYDYHQNVMPSMAGGAPIPPSPSVPTHEPSYWYEGRPNGDSHRQYEHARPPHSQGHGQSMTEGSGWHHQQRHHHHHQHHQQQQQQKQHRMAQAQEFEPPPPTFQHKNHHSYKYPYQPGIQRTLSTDSAPTGSRNMGERVMQSSSSGRGLRSSSSSQSKASRNSSAVTQSPRPGPSSGSSQNRTGEEEKGTSQEEKNADKKSGDSLSLLAKVSSAMANDGNNKQGGQKDRERGNRQELKDTKQNSTYPSSPAQRPKPREVTPTAAVSTPEQHSSYPSRGPPPEIPYWESDYPRHANVQEYPSRFAPYRARGEEMPTPRLTHHSQHYPPHNPPPPPQYYPHPQDSGWRPEEVTESPPPLVEHSPSYEGELDHYSYYPPPPTMPSFEQQTPYERSARGPPPAQPNWKGYPSHPPPSATPSSWSGNPDANYHGSVEGRGRLPERESTRPSSPPRHSYPPPRWSYEFGRPYDRNYQPPPGAPRMVNSTNEAPGPRINGGNPSFFSTQTPPPRRSSYPAADLKQGSQLPPPASYPAPHHRNPPQYPYAPPTSKANVPIKDSSATYSPYTYVQKAHVEEKTVLKKKFSWKHYPELEQFLISHRDEYLRHSCMNYTAEQKQYNNWLTDRLLQVAEEHHYEFDKEDFNFVAIRDRIRCYYKSYVQTARKRGLPLPQTPLDNNPANATNSNKKRKLTTKSNSASCNKNASSIDEVSNHKTSETIKGVSSSSSSSNHRFYGYPSGAAYGSNTRVSESRFTSSVTIMPGNSYHSCAISIA